MQPPAQVAVDDSDLSRAIAERNLLARELGLLEVERATPVQQKGLRLSEAPAKQSPGVPDNGCPDMSPLVDEAPLTSTNPSSHHDAAVPDAPSLISRPPMPPLTWVKKTAPAQHGQRQSAPEAARGIYSPEDWRRARPSPVKTHTSDEEASPEPRRHASHPFRRVSSRLVPASARAASDTGPGVSDPCPNVSHSAAEAASHSAAEAASADAWHGRSLDFANSHPENLTAKPYPLDLDARPLKPPPRSPRPSRRAVRRRASALVPVHARLSSWQPSEQPSPDFDRAVERVLRTNLEEERACGGQENSSAGEASPVKMPTPFKPRLKLGRSPPPVSVR